MSKGAKLASLAAVLVLVMAGPQILKLALGIIDHHVAPVEQVGTRPNRSQEATCAEVAGMGVEPWAATAFSEQNRGVRNVSGTVVSDPLHGALGIGIPDIELEGDRMHLAITVDGQDLLLLVHGIPNRHTQIGDALHFCGAFAEEAFLWPLVGYQKPTYSIFGGHRGGPEYGPPDPTRYRRVLWVRDLDVNP